MKKEQLFSDADTLTLNETWVMLISQWLCIFCITEEFSIRLNTWLI